MMFICSMCSVGRHEDCLGGCDCQHRVDGTPSEKHRDEWRVCDDTGTFHMYTSDWTVAQNALRTLPGDGTIWHRSVIERITAWRRVETVEIPHG